MREETGAMQIFTPEMLETMAHIWTRSSISLMDVRHKSIYPEHPLQHYKMPSSMLVYAYGGTANVQLNETAFTMERFGLFHGGKGTMLSISPDEVTLGSYMMLYKAETPPFFKKDLQRLLEQVNPFVQQFGYAPNNPVWLIRLFQQMMESWSRATAMNHFHTKNLFYQSIYEIYKDLEQEQAAFLQPDPVISAKRYLDEHYMRPILFQELADLFSISSGQLTRLFKKREGKSLQEYAIQKRLNDALLQLENTNANVKEIAIGCGFADEGNFFRIFKKHFKMTPIDYRKIKRQSMQECTIDNDYQRLYNEIGLEHLAKSQGDGEFTMFGQTRSKQMILAAAMSLLLLLSACGTNAPTNTNGAGTQNTPPAAATTQTPEVNETPMTRIYTDLAGREVEIPTRAKRILATNTIGEAIALGVKPIASSDNYLRFLDDDQKAGIESIGSNNNTNLEKLASLEPDLIIVPERVTEAEELEAYSKIAPTVVGPFFRGAEVGLRTVGDILGRSEEVEAWLQEYQEKAKKTKEALSDVVKDGQTGIVFQFYGKSMAIYPIGTFPTVNEVLGLKPPVESMNDLTQGLELSLEMLPEYAADHIFVTTGSTFDQEYYDGIMSSSIWKGLPAVKNNQVYFIGSRITSGDVLSLDWALDEVVKLMSSR